jgi:hypothetical protein
MCGTLLYKLTIHYYTHPWTQQTHHILLSVAWSFKSRRAPQGLPSATLIYRPFPLSRPTICIDRGAPHPRWWAWNAPAFNHHCQPGAGAPAGAAHHLQVISCLIHIRRILRLARCRPPGSSAGPFRFASVRKSGIMHKTIAPDFARIIMCRNQGQKWGRKWRCWDTRECRLTASP